MAHHVEPMDIDSDFDNKENSLHHNNVLPFTEKGYEELDVSELNMKLRYSITPASSPMTRSCTADCLDNKPLELSGGSLNVTVSENNNLSRSLNSTMTKSDSVIKSLKTLPLQTRPTEQFVENSRSSLSLRPHDATITQDITVTVSGPSDIDENLSLPSSSSSAVHTPEATTPTKDVPKSDGSPIMRGLKSVLNMFRSSQSPIPPTESDDAIKSEILSPVEGSSKVNEGESQAMQASTPLAAHRKKETSPTKRSSPNRDSIVFNDDLEKELQWKDETTILFSQERIPIHKLFYAQPQVKKNIVEVLKTEKQDDLDSTTEYMDISYNDSIRDRTMTDIQANKTDYTIAAESDSEFVDCETTFTKNSTMVIEDKDETPKVDEVDQTNTTPEVNKPNNNVSASRLKQIILNTTQDILDATLSITPEDLISQTLNNTSGGSQLETTDTNLNLTGELAPEITNTTVDKIETATSNDMVSTESVKPKELDVTTSETSECVKPVIPDQTINVIAPSEHTESKTDTDATQTFENILVQSESAAQILDSTIIKDETPTPISVTELVQQANEMKETVENTTHVSETIEPTNSSPAPLDEAITKPLSTDDIVTSPIEILTDLPVDIPLPDEDDIDKDVPDSAAVEVPAPCNLPLDLVDHIQAKTESHETQSGIIEEVKLDENVNITVENVSPVVALPEIAVIDNGNKQNQMEDIHSEADLIQEVIQSDVSNEKPISNELQNKELDDLPEVLPISNTQSINQEQGDVSKAVEALNIMNNVTESVNANDTPNELNIIKNPDEVVPMDINESMESKPLPDIINQTITMSNAENVEQNTSHELPQVGDALPEQIGFEQEESQAPCPEIISDAGNNEVPELISDVVTAPISEESNVTADIVPTELPIETSNEETALPVTETHSIDSPVVLENMSEITYSSTWSEAQVLLLENSAFKNDVSLLGMDKEDALIVFEQHIRNLEAEYLQEREQVKKRNKRQQRKNRDNFLVLLDTLHEEGKLTSMSLWVELYPVISADMRFSAMLGQSGSTPLDLFKFYVENLKARFHDEKKVIKEILKEKSFDVKPDTTFEEFATVVCEDSKSASLDAGNVKLTYNSLLEKAEARNKEKIKEESKAQKKIESAFKWALTDANIDHQLSWNEVKEKLDLSAPEFAAVPYEEDRVRIYKDFQHEQEESCMHYHHPKSRKAKRSKKKKRSHSASLSRSRSPSPMQTARSPSPVPSHGTWTSDEGRKHKKSKKKHRKHSPIPKSPTPEEGGITDDEQLRHKSKKSKRSAPSSPEEEAHEHAHKPKKKKDKKEKKERSSGSTAWSDAELESRRAALLAQLHEHEAD